MSASMPEIKMKMMLANLLRLKRQKNAISQTIVSVGLVCKLP